MTPTIDTDKLEETAAVSAADHHDYSLMELINLIRLEYSGTLKSKIKHQMKDLKEGLNEIKILNQMRHLFVSGSNKEDGSFTVSDDFKTLIDQINQPENENLQKILKDIGIDPDVTNGKIYTKDEKLEMIEQIRSTIEQKHTLNDMAFQAVTRIESEIDQMYQYLMSTIRTIHETLLKLARGIKGG